MIRNHDDNKPRVLETAIRFRRQLAMSSTPAIFVTALSFALILFTAHAATAGTVGGIRPCVTGHLFEPGPIVNGHNRQPTQTEIEERTQELYAIRASAASCR
jgi:hypothetical protein